jgi:hypothetical protein
LIQLEKIERRAEELFGDKACMSPFVEEEYYAKGGYS